MALRITLFKDSIVLRASLTNTFYVKIAAPCLLKHVCGLAFFATLIANVDMVIAKTDLIVAKRYAELFEDALLRNAIFERIKNEYQLTTDVLNLIIDSDITYLISVVPYSDILNKRYDSSY